MMAFRCESRRRHRPNLPAWSPLWWLAGGAAARHAMPAILVATGPSAMAEGSAHREGGRRIRDGCRVGCCIKESMHTCVEKAVKKTSNNKDDPLGFMLKVAAGRSCPRWASLGAGTRAGAALRSTGLDIGPTSGTGGLGSQLAEPSGYRSGWPDRPAVAPPTWRTSSQYLVASASRWGH